MISEPCNDEELQYVTPRFERHGQHRDYAHELSGNLVGRILLLHCLTRILIVYRTSVLKFLRVLNIHRVRPLGVNPLIVHRRSALVRRPIVDALPSILIAAAHGTQTEARIVGIAALGSA